MFQGWLKQSTVAGCKISSHVAKTIITSPIREWFKRPMYGEFSDGVLLFCQHYVQLSWACFSQVWEHRIVGEGSVNSVRCTHTKRIVTILLTAYIYGISNKYIPEICHHDATGTQISLESGVFTIQNRCLKGLQVCISSGLCCPTTSVPIRSGVAIFWLIRAKKDGLEKSSLLFFVQLYPLGL